MKFLLDHDVPDSRMTHAGIIVLIRRKSRALERSALVRLLDRAGESGISGNFNFA